MDRDHVYRARLEWEGNTGEGTRRYEGYGRDYRLLFEGKQDLVGSADPLFRGDPGRHNPEELFLAAIAACHLLSYLALCAREGIVVVSYTDGPEGRMVLTNDGGGRFEEVTLNPHVVVAKSSMVTRARDLHDRARELCFIANSCNFPVRHLPEIAIA